MITIMLSVHPYQFLDDHDRKVRKKNAEKFLNQVINKRLKIYIKKKKKKKKKKKDQR